MSDRIDTHSQDLSPQHDPALCPPWCSGSHLRDEITRDGWHHDGEPANLLGDEQTLYVKPSQYVSPLDGAHVAAVELQDDNRTVALLSPREARELAETLVEAARDITAAALLPVGTVEMPDGPWWLIACPSWCLTAHGAADQPSDRIHYSGDATAERRIDLTLADPPKRPDGTPYDDAPCLDTYLTQHVREAEARVTLSVNEMQGTDLTISEAEALRDHLDCLIRDARRG